MSLNNRKKIGVIIDRVDETCQSLIWPGVIDYARAHNVDVRIFIATATSENRSITNYDLIEKLLSKENLDGIIIAAGAMRYFFSKEEVYRFCHSFHEDMPVLTLSMKIEGITSLLIDNQTGLMNAVSHLIVAHTCRKIAFIKGPDGHDEAEERFNAYKRALRRHKIDFDENLIVKGNFSQESGIEGVKTLFFQRGLKPDAIVCVDDDTAIGALIALKEHDINVPSSVKVTGFDDIDVAFSFNPPITTVKQQLFDQGRKAAEILIDIIDGKAAPLEVYLPTSLIIRESCGCFSMPTYTELKNMPKDRMPSIKQIKKYLVPQIADELDSTHIERSTLYQWVGEILDAISEFLKGRKTERSLLKMVNSIINCYFISGGNMARWHNIFAILYNDFLSEFRNKENTYQIEYIYQKLRSVISNYFTKGQNINHNEILLKSYILRDVSESLIACYNFDKFFNLLESGLVKLNVPSCYITLFNQDLKDKNDIGNLPEESRLIFATKNYTRIEIKNEYFKTKGILPDIEGTEALIFMSLNFSTKRIGFIAFEHIEEDISIYETLRSHVSIAIEGILLFDEVIKSKGEIDKLNKSLERRVRERTEELNQANEELTEVNKELLVTNEQLNSTLDTLKKTQKQLIHSEKMVALGSLVAGLAHEINTPVGVCVSAASFMDQNLSELLNLYMVNQLRKSDFENFLNSGSETCKILLINLKKASELIASFKLVAADQASEEKRTFRIKEYIEQILVSLKPRLKNTRHTIEIKCSEELEINSYPGALSQVITNLVMNSLIHAFHPDEKGMISFDVIKLNSHISITYRDNGAGIREEHIDKIFDPFFTTKRGSGGTGLGLNIVYNLVTQTLGGSIRCESENGKGTSFIIEIPVSLI